MIRKYFLPVLSVVGIMFAVVTAVHVRTSDAVRAGDPLFEIDSRDQHADLRVRQAQVATAKAEVATQEAHVADARSEYERWRTVPDARAISEDELERRRYAVVVAEARLGQARAAVEAADAAVAATQTELDRRIIRSPVGGQVLQVKVRQGEFASAGALATPLMLVGDVDVVHVRVDVDENDAWRIDPGARAEATVRGNKDLRTDLRFVRVEPYVVPKRSLTGESTERVDTRVLQVLYAFDRAALPVYVGQQMDVFIEDGK